MRASLSLFESTGFGRGTLLVLALFFAAAVVRPLVRPYTYSDFATFYGAARCFDDGRNPYDPAALESESGFEGWVGRYFYPPPFAACFVRPLARLPLAIARRIWVVFEAAAYLTAALLLGRSWGKTRFERGLVLAVFLPYAPIVLDLKLGSVSGFLLLLLVAFVLHFEKAQKTRAALSLAAATLLKLSPLFVAAYLLARGQWRFVGRCLVCGLALVAVCLPWTGVDAYVEYFTRVVPHLATANFSWFTNQSVDAYWGRILLSNPDTTPWLHAPGLHRAVTWSLNLVLLAGLLALARRTGPRATSFAWEIGAVLIVALLVPRVTWEYMFVLALPAFVLWLLEAVRRRVSPPQLASVLAAYVLCALPFPYAEIPNRGVALLLEGPRLAGGLLLFGITWWRLSHPARTG